MAKRWQLTRTYAPADGSMGYSLNLWEYRRIPDAVESVFHMLCHVTGLALRKLGWRSPHTCWMHYWANDWNNDQKIVLAIPMTDEQATTYLTLHPKIAKRFEYGE